VAVTDEAANVVARYRYDAWGKSQQSAGTTDPTRRGYTGHEELDGLSLVNMNGRVYDPLIGRFTAVDPILQDGSNWQNYNGYSYVLNNPLMQTDPSGQMSWPIQFAATFAVMVATPNISGFIWGDTYGTMAAHTWQVGMVQGATGGFIAGGIQGGTLQSAVEGGLFGALNGAIGYKFDPGTFNNIAFHAVLGGFQSAALGGDFKSGFLSAGISAAASSQIESVFGKSPDIVSRAERIAAAAMIGGTTSVIAGGKFGNGAITAAFERTFNGESNIEANGLAGKAGEAARLKQLVDLGAENIRSQVHLVIETTEGTVTAVADHVYEFKGRVVFEEVKVGLEAKLSGGQAKVYAMIERGEVKFLSAAIGRTYGVAAGETIASGLSRIGISLAAESEGRAARSWMRVFGMRGLGLVSIIGSLPLQAATFSLPAGTPYDSCGVWGCTFRFDK